MNDTSHFGDLTRSDMLQRPPQVKPKKHQTSPLLLRRHLYYVAIIRSGLNARTIKGLLLIAQEKK
ncbi:hypothetical protein O3W44_23500 [Pantoea sp. LMR881]|uniref:hypothetical protein n=1 Tax=Pantoea sp. LMR881 TaxID=3014336 RepID=UPI0022B02DC5|nr:hypothetical protein [Pantoea sp. LMR881]MCZ4061469.1 hypothetical protein [Pantoea sp. LMR881]